jgi:hypothetical protein
MTNEKQQTVFAYSFPDVYHKTLLNYHKHQLKFKVRLQLEVSHSINQVWERGKIRIQYGRLETVSMVETMDSVEDNNIIFKNRSVDKS